MQRQIVKPDRDMKKLLLGWRKAKDDLEYYEQQITSLVAGDIKATVQWSTGQDTIEARLVEAHDVTDYEATCRAAGVTADSVRNAYFVKTWVTIDWKRVYDSLEIDREPAPRLAARRIPTRVDISVK